MNMNTFAQYANLTSSLVTVATVVFIIQIVFKWQSSPRFSVGVLPSEDEQKEEGITALGKPSLFDEFVFDKRYLARELATEDEIASLKNDNDSSRHVYRDASDRIRLPVIVQNDGRSKAQEYALVFSFSHPGIRIADVQTETLEVEALYTQDDAYVQNQNLKAKLPSEDLRSIYRGVNLVSDYLGLTGGMTGGTFEAISLKLYVPKDCQDFSIFFKIDCADFFYYQRQVNGQHINVFERT